MSIIRSSHDFSIPAPSSIENTQDTDAWLASMSDSGWRVLTDFRHWPHWIPEVHSVIHTGWEPPATGTKLEVEKGHKTVTCSIEVWDPPRSLQICINLASGEMAYGFLIETSSKNADMRISLKLERRFIGVSRIAVFFFR